MICCTAGRYPAWLFAVLCSTPQVAAAAPWVADPGFFSENANAASSMVDAADLNGDGWIDLVFANGSGFDQGPPGSDLPQQAFFNQAGQAMLDHSDQVFGGVTFNGRAIKVRDIDNDGDNDILLGVTWQQQSQLFLNIDGQGSFINATADHLPQVDASIGDLELGDVDFDGDLDIILADWGPDSPVSDVNTPGGVPRLWTQIGNPGLHSPGTGMFEDVTLGQIPNRPIRWSWDLELVDIDNDYDLDVVISCFACNDNSLVVFTNDGSGTFADGTPDNVDQTFAALAVEAMDIDKDGNLDLVALHDGVGGRDRILLGDGQGGFADLSDKLWLKQENSPSFDLAAVFLDHDSNLYPDIVIGAMQSGDTNFPDRLIANQGGMFTQKPAAFAEQKPSTGTYALVLADFNQDRILDVAMAQHDNTFEKQVLLGNDAELMVDTAQPMIANYEKLPPDAEFGAVNLLRARVHDHKSPLMLHDFQTGDGVQDGRPYLESWDGDPGDPDQSPGDISTPGQWYGEYLWVISFDIPKSNRSFHYRICTIDAAGNKECTIVEHVDASGATTSTTDDCSSDGCLSSAGLTSPTVGFTTQDCMSGCPTTAPETTTIDPSGPATTGPSTPSSATSEQAIDDGLVQHDCACRDHGSRPPALFATLLLLGLRRRGR